LRFRTSFWLAVLGAIAAHAQTPAAGVPPLKKIETGPRVGISTMVKITLEEVIERVLAANTDLAVARVETDKALFAVRGALGAYDPVVGMETHRLRSVTPAASVLQGGVDGKLTSEEWGATPQIGGLLPELGGSYSLAFSNLRQTTDNAFSTLNPQYPTSLQLTWKQPLWRGLHFDEARHTIAVARKNRQLTMEQLRQRVTDVVTQAVQAYWELDYAWQSFQVQTEAVHLAEQQYESNRRQAEQGTLAPVDVVAAQTQVATFQQAVFGAQQALTEAENNLKMMMLPNREDPLWNASLEPETQWKAEANVPELADAVKGALASRPELAESELAITINKLDEMLAREQTKPRVDAFANLSTTGLAGKQFISSSNTLTSGFTPLITLLNQLAALNGLQPVTSLSFGTGDVPKMFLGSYAQSLSNLYSGTFPAVEVGLQVQLPLRNRTAQAQAATAAAEGKRLRALRDQARMLVEREVRNALQSAATTQARLEAAGVARRSAQEQYASEQRQFQAGTSTVFLVFQRQTDFIAARSREVRARADAAEAAAMLDRAIARTIETHGIRIEQ